MLPEKRTEVLYARVTEVNKQFITEAAEKEGVSESALVDHILSAYRRKSVGVSDKKRLRKSS